MCGRYAQYTSLPELLKIFKIETVTDALIASYNIAPLDRVPAVIHQDGNRLVTFHWGLVPFWSKDTSRASALINARSETVDKKPSFRDAFKKRRCLIPADGFFEWKTEGRQKQPWYFTMPSGNPFAFAGLWETWHKADGAEYRSCAIITTEADETVRPVHPRMPVILTPEVHAAWLDPRKRDLLRLKDILADGRMRGIKRFPVSRRVNSPTNNDPACIEPIELNS